MPGSRKRKPKIIIAPKCDYCGSNNERFIVTATQQTFCMEQTPGHPPDKDCHTAWLTQEKNVQEKKEESLQSQKKEQLQQEEKKIDPKERAAILDKLKSYQLEMKQRSFREKKI